MGRISHGPRFSACLLIAGGPSAAQLHRHLAPNTSWAAARLMSLTPHLRQLQALVAMQALPARLRQELLAPSAPAAAAAAAAGTLLPVGLRDALRQRYNASQQAAISTALEGFQRQAEGAGRAVAPAGSGGGPAAAAAAADSGPASPCFTLIQGPPGTGKTAAIVGILSGLLVTNEAKGGPRQRGGDGANEGRCKPGRSAEVVNPTVRYGPGYCAKLVQACSTATAFKGA
jgi:hypothetical protein